MTEPLGIIFLGLGMQPVSRLEQIEWVPKQRYRIMAPYMLKVGKLGQRMMKQTATVQANIDYSDEKDAMAKFRTGMGLAPVLVAMFANSPICDGQLNGYRSFREHIWTDTDRSRSGLLKFAFAPEVSFAHYVEYALDVPMYFIVRNKNYIDMTAVTFRQFLTSGYNGERATIEDWNDHLTTLFPETRIKRYHRDPLRRQPTPGSHASPVGADQRRLLRQRLSASGLGSGEGLELGRTHAGLSRLPSRCAGARAFRRYSLLDLARELVEIAWEGLGGNNQVNDLGDDETIYLKPLKDLLSQGKCPADVLLEKWEGELHHDIKRLIAYSAYKLR